MSSFLDSTGLDRLATKLKAYFMKKPTTASSSSYPLVGYDATNNVGKYNSDITLDMANKFLSALAQGVYNEYNLGITTDSVSDDLNGYNDPINAAGITVLRIGDDVKANVQNKPVDSGGCCVVVSNAGGYAHQLYFATNGSNTVYMRERYKASWRNWKQIVLSDGTYPNMTAGYAVRSQTMYDGSSSGMNNGVHTYGTQNTNNNMSGWKKICTIKKGDTYQYSSAVVSGIIFATDSNWGQKVSYRTHFRVRLDFSVPEASVCLDCFPIQKRFIRLIEVSYRDTYEIQVQPQSISVYGAFWLYGFTDAANNCSVSWSTANLTEPGSDGTLSDNYEYDARYSGSAAWFMAVNDNYVLPKVTRVALAASNTVWVRIKNFSTSAITITATGNSLSMQLAAGSIMDFYYYDHGWHTL